MDPRDGLTEPDSRATSCRSRWALRLIYWTSTATSIVNLVRPTTVQFVTLSVSLSSELDNTYDDRHAGYLQKRALPSGTLSGLTTLELRKCRHGTAIVAACYRGYQSNRHTVTSWLSHVTNLTVWRTDRRDELTKGIGLYGDMPTMQNEQKQSDLHRELKNKTLNFSHNFPKC